jgi:hypothetical protein
VSDLNNIEKLFEEKFENFEMPVRTELWSQVAQGASIEKTVFWTSAKIAASVIIGVVAISAVTWYTMNLDSKSNNSSAVVNAIVENEEEIQEEIDVLPFEAEPLNFKSAAATTFPAPKSAIQLEKSNEFVDEVLIPELTQQEDIKFNESKLVLDIDKITAPESINIVEPSVKFEPAPRETLTLEILIAPEKSEEKSLEQIHFPQEFVKIFNPNLPGESGQFSIYSEDLRTFKIEIRSRRGTLIYTSSDPNFVWRGEQMDGSKAPEGTYLYTVFAETNNGELIKPQSGSVFLMRKQ